MKIIDFHVHPLPAISSRQLLQELNSVNAEKAVLLAMELDPSLVNNSKKLRKDISKRFEYTTFFDLEPIFSGMDYILNMGDTPMEHVSDLVSSHKDKFIGFGSVHLGYKPKRYVRKKLQQIKKLKDEQDFKGIKILPTLQFFSPQTNSGLSEVFKFAEKNDLIVLYHTGCDPGPWEIPLLSEHGNPYLIEPLLRKYNVKVVLAHMGSYSSRIPGIWFDEAVKLIENYPDVYGDLSAVPYLMNQEESVKVLREKNIISKVLYGSDYPVTSAGGALDMKTIVDMILESEILTDGEKEKIFYANALDLLNQ